MIGQDNGPDKLAVIWSSGDREVARKLVFMYAKNSKLQGWWDKVDLVVWGPSAQLLSVDKELQEELEDLKATGVDLLAWQACSDMYGVSAELESLGIKVVYMGTPLTDYLKTGCKVLTF